MRDFVLGSEKLRMILMPHSAHFGRRAARYYTVGVSYEW